MGRKAILRIGGRAIDVEVGTDEECEAATVVVCGSVSYFSDDMHTTCALCQTPIVHRPYVPKTPPKVCLPCVHRLLTAKES